MPRSIDKRRSDSQGSEETDADEIPDRIYGTVVSAILDRVLDPGTKLPEEVSCSHYGVSRTIVREADKAAGHMTAHLDHIERDLLQGTEDEERPTLESVLARSSKGDARPGRARKLQLVVPAPE